MTNEELKAALEALIAEAQARGPGRILTAAERNAVLWVTDREDSPQATRPDCPVGLVPPPGQLH
jgi:hypothetical protein